MKARLFIVGHVMLIFAAASWARPFDLRNLFHPAWLFCGAQGAVCCEVYRGSSGGVIGPSHCNERLGCNVATNTCELPCGNPGQVCCDGPETVAAQGGPLYKNSSGNFVLRAPMCSVGAICSPTTRRCVNDCGNRAGDACCGPQPQLAVASCINPLLACKFDSIASTSGVCQPCGELGQIPCARLHGGCSDGLIVDRNGLCACSPDQRKDEPVASLTSCTNWPDRRAHCFSLAPRGPRHTISGSELRPKLNRGEVCVESGFQVTDGIVLVDVDNPRIWDGGEVIGATRTAGGASFQAADHLTTIADGQGDSSRGGFFAFDTSGPVASVDATLSRIPSRIGEFGMGAAPELIDLLTPGIRVGPSPVTVNIVDVQSDGKASRPIAPFRMALNPAVLLVPVQVFSVFSDQIPGAADAFTREMALILFDRGADVGVNKWHGTDGDGRLSSTTVPLPYVVLDGDARPTQARSHVLPDDIWAQCGIQFRLVNYSRIKVANEIAIPPAGTHIDVQGAPRELFAEIRRSPPFLEGVLTVMVAPWCSDVNQSNRGEWFPPLGQALLGTNAVCIRFSAGGTTLAHEIGHSIMDTAGHVDCTRLDSGDNLMCPENGGPMLTAEQCARARKVLVGSGPLQFPAPR